MRKLFGLILLIVSFSAVAQDTEGKKEDALALFRAKKYEQAIEVCLAELESFPRNRDSYAVLGWSLLSLKRYDEIIAYHTKALEFARNDYRLIETIAEAHFYKRQYNEALKYFQEYVRIHPKGALVGDAYAFMGGIYYGFGEFNNSDIAFSAAVHYKPSVGRWWIRLASARERAGNLESAKVAYQKALQLNPNDSQAREGLARVGLQ